MVVGGWVGGGLLAHLASFSNYTTSQECRPVASVLLLLPDPGLQVPSSHFVFIPHLSRYT